ncbi:Ig-like domain-containing protein, partial [Undibacterium sp. TJN19]|uniref:Ig-like domain-containing protein n=1 Tax=Undibacterium sp. TJN19 TaxID=3413055 RepID=UPI003BF0C80F
GNFATAQGAQIAAGIYVDQGDIKLTTGNNFVFLGDMFASNISTTNGGPTSFVYRSVFSSAITPGSSTGTPPAVSFVSPANNANFGAPANITLTATATADTTNGSTISQVQFYQGTILIGTASTPTPANSSTYSVTWSNVVANSYSITAKATDSKNATTSSAPVTVNVVNNNAPTVSLT